MADKALNVNDIRQILGEEIQKIRGGKTTAANVNAITNAIGKTLSTIKLQMEYSRLTGKAPEIGIFESSDPPIGAFEEEEPEGLKIGKKKPTMKLASSADGVASKV